VMERCSQGKCRRPVALTYLKKKLCWHHWVKLCEKQEREEQRRAQREERAP
jgi:hypothetical protein